MAVGVPQSKPVPPDSPVEPGDVIAGKYRVDSVIAVGGMGIVVSAEHLQLGQEVAIKVLLPTELAQEPHAATRFLREARAAARIRSDHVVRIYDVDSLENGLPYMVMERLQGCDLRALLRSRGPLPIEDVVAYVIHAGDAVGEAHRMGIVHRDLKPSNLFLATRSDGGSLVKVLDFGISKTAALAALEGTLTTSRTLIGSPLYMSPEQIRDPKAVDARSDIWSFGVILHQLLTGKPAFTADSLPAVCAAIAADAPASTRALRPDVPEALEQLIQTCLEKRPENRFQSVEELCQALAPFGRMGLSSSGASLSQPLSSPRWIPASGVRDPDVGSGSVSERLVAFPTAAERLLSDAPLAATQPTAKSSALGRPRVLVPIAIALAVALAVAVFFMVRPRSGPDNVAQTPPATPTEATPPPSPADTERRVQGTLAPVQEPRASASAPPPIASPPTTATQRRPPHKPSSPALPAPTPKPDTDIRLER